MALLPERKGVAVGAKSLSYHFGLAAMRFGRRKYLHRLQLGYLVATQGVHVCI